jgi:Ulp1 family protease
VIDLSTFQEESSQTKELEQMKPTLNPSINISRAKRELKWGSFVSDDILMPVLMSEISSNKHFVMDSHIMTSLKLGQGHNLISSFTRRISSTVETIFFPTHIPLHWILTVLDLKSYSIEIWDSLGKTSKRELEWIMNAIIRWLKDFRGVNNPTCQLVQPTEKVCLQSPGSNNCAMFVILFACAKAAGLVNSKILDTITCQQATELRSKILSYYLK